MAEISQLQINGTTYDICDATARNSISQNEAAIATLQNKIEKGFVMATFNTGYYLFNRPGVKGNDRITTQIRYTTGTYAVDHAIHIVADLTPDTITFYARTGGSRVPDGTTLAIDYIIVKA